MVIDKANLLWFAETSFVKIMQPEVHYGLQSLYTLWIPEKEHHSMPDRVNSYQ